MTTKLEVILASVLGLVLACLAAGIWYHFHNASERKEGAAACVQATTTTKAAVLEENTGDVTAQAADLKTTVAQQNEKIDQLSRGNAALVSQLYEHALRPSAVSNSGRVTGASCDAGALREGQGDPGAAVKAAEVAVFNDCDIEHARADSAVKAYNDWRQRMIERSQKTPTAVTVR